MRARKLGPLVAVLSLLAVRSASSASLPASTWPEKLGKEDVACLAALRPADHLVHSAEEIPGRLERIRSAWLVCQGSEVDARFFARSARLRLTLSELNDNADRLSLMREARRRLERLREPSPELFRVLEELGSLACQNKDLDATISSFEDARRLREQIYGEKSFEASVGMIHLARIHAAACETERPNLQRARMYAELAVDNFIGCGEACRPAYLYIVMQYSSVLEEMGLQEGAQEISNLFLREWGDSPGVQAILERDDEPLPEAPGQE